MLKYTGGKSGSGVYQQIINQMPPHQIYVEAFLGGGSVMAKKKPADLNIGIDMDESVISHWRSHLAISSFPAMVANTTTIDDIAGGTATIGGMGLHHQKQRCQLAPPETMVAADTTTIDGSSGEYRFVTGDALQWLQSNDDYLLPDTLLYCDPPYLAETRTSQRDLYQYEMKSHSEHIELLNLLMGLDCMIILSGYASRLYDGVLSGWRRIEYQAMSHGGQRTEVLWMNYPEPTRLHDYRYLGSDYRERERIKKKKDRWASKWASLPALERYAILAAIEEVEGV